ncbi:MAG TPA: hypothetical protein VEA69_24890 [Tepidisphaeraceae bacterium]|nr:hypothetical protein [Tepidisphaeraceae bacterium]
MRNLSLAVLLLPILASAEPPAVTRFEANPIVRPEMLPGRDGQNINGPSLIRVPDFVVNPLGKYYLYFAHHNGQSIRLAYADDLRGPWKVHAPGTLHLEDVPACQGHIASPDVHVDTARKQIRMYFHGPSRKARGQKSFVATSADGISFKPSDEVLGLFYFRVVEYGGAWYAMAKGGMLYRSADGLTKFEPAGRSPLKNPENAGADFNAAGSVRHVALQLTGNRLRVYYTRIGDAPERIVRAAIDLKGDWKEWMAGPDEEVLKPEAEYEGAKLPVVASKAGAVHGAENALRDPAIFSEGGKTYLIYSVAGERGLAMAEVVEKE